MLRWLVWPWDRQNLHCTYSCYNLTFLGPRNNSNMEKRTKFHYIFHKRLLGWALLKHEYCILQSNQVPTGQWGEQEWTSTWCLLGCLAKLANNFCWNCSTFCTEFFTGPKQLIVLPISNKQTQPTILLLDVNSFFFGKLLLGPICHIRKESESHSSTQQVLILSAF